MPSIQIELPSACLGKRVFVLPVECRASMTHGRQGAVDWSLLMIQRPWDGVEDCAWTSLVASREPRGREAHKRRNVVAEWAPKSGPRVPQEAPGWAVWAVWVEIWAEILALGPPIAPDRQAHVLASFSGLQFFLLRLL